MVYLSLYIISLLCFGIFSSGQFLQGKIHEKVIKKLKDGIDVAKSLKAGNNGNIVLK